MSDLTLAERVANLEGRTLTLADLPLAAMQRKLESDWQPDAALLLQPNSITFDALAGGIKPQAGVATLAWPGGAAVSTPLVVKHSLGSIPVVTPAVGACAGLTAVPSIQVTGRTATQFTVTAQTVDGQLPLATATTEINWIGLA